MTYFWFCVSAWLVLNAVTAFELVRHYRSERRDTRVLRTAEQRLWAERVAERRRIFEARGGAR